MKIFRVLIVEDDPDNLELVRFLLARVGYEVLAAEDGLKGLNVARREKPDLILLDLAMPELDGWSVARLLKEDPSLQSIPVVALTAYALPGDRRRAIQAGCDGYMTKPLNVSTFTQEIARHFNVSAGSPTA